jgi:hypothetical protein
LVAPGPLGRWLRQLRKRIAAGLRSRWAGRIAIVVLLVRLLGALLTSAALARECLTLVQAVDPGLDFLTDLFTFY